jgi:hypothetical protein
MSAEPMQIPAQPLPGQWAIAATDPPNQFVLIVVTDAAGQRFLFLAPDAAEQIGKQIVDAARAARTGIVVPPLLLPGSSNENAPSQGGDPRP